MGSNTYRVGSDIMAFFGVMSMVIAAYFVAGLRTALPWHTDLFESVAWGKLFAGAVYAGLSGLFFWMCLHR